jgi:hypothetical protein
MKKFLLIIFIIAKASIILFAQQPTEEWVRRFSDTASTNWNSLSIKQDSLGFIYVLAETSNDFGFLKYNQNGNLMVVTTHWPGGFSYGGGGYMDVTSFGDVYISGLVGTGNLYWIYTVKFNTYGVFQWGKLYNLHLIDSPSDQKIDKMGNVIIAGGIGFGNSSTGLIIKYNPLGDTIWTRFLDNGQSMSNFTKITLDNNDNIYVTGKINTMPRCLIAKYNSLGVLEWIKNFTGDSTEPNIGQGISIDVFGNIYVLDVCSVPSSIFNDYLLKVNQTGTIQWSKIFSGVQNGQGWNDGLPVGPIVSSDGNSIYYSTRTMNDTAIGGWRYDIATLKYNSNGVQQWIKLYSGGGLPGTANYPGNIKLDSNNNIYLCGTGNYPTTGDDCITLKYAPTGVQQWLIKYGGIYLNSADDGNDLLIDNNQNVFITGSSRRINVIDYVTVTIKYSQVVQTQINNQEIPTDNKLLQNYPNPFNNDTKFRVQISKFGFVNIKVYDILGREKYMILNQKLNPGTYEMTLNGNDLVSGVYFYQLFIDGLLIETKKLVLIK